MMVKNKKLWLIASALFGFGSLFAQDWDWVAIFDGPGNESISDLTLVPSNEVWAGGSFDQSQEWNGWNLQTIGQEDLILIKFDPSGAPLFPLAGGSADTDESVDLEPAPDQGVYWTGIFWDQIFWDNGFALASPVPGKAVFLVRVDSSGNILWGTSLNSTGNTQVTDMLVAPDGDVWLCGFFSETLYFDLGDLTATGSSDAWLARFSADGDMEYAQRLGGAGQVEAMSLASGPDGSLLLGGTFNGTWQAGTTLFESPTADEDAFLLRLLPTGGVLWAKKAGAQYGDFGVAIASTDERVFFAGRFLGPLEVSPGWEISTVGFNEDIFLIAYDLDGVPLWASAEGGTGNEVAQDLIIRKQGPLLAGGFFSATQIGGQTFSGQGSVIDGFIGAWNESGDFNWGQSLATDVFLLPEKLQVDAEDRVLAAGSFSGDWESIHQAEGFAGFVGRLAETATTVSELPISQRPSAFPNPFSEELHFTSMPADLYRLDCYDILGRLWQEEPTDLPPGLYIWRGFDREGRQLFAVKTLKQTR